MPPFDEQSDSTAEFIALLSKSERRLAGYVMSLVPVVADADEVLQETRTQLWSEFGRYDPAKSFESWALTIAYYQVLTYRKRRDRSKLVFSSDLIELLSEELKNQERGDRTDALRGCLAKLGGKTSQIVMEHYSGAGIAKLSESWSMSGEAIRKLVYRARKSLHECINRALSTAEGGGQTPQS